MRPTHHAQDGTPDLQQGSATAGRNHDDDAWIDAMFDDGPETEAAPLSFSLEDDGDFAMDFV